MLGGFAFMHPDSTLDVAAVEAVPLDDLDPKIVVTVHYVSDLHSASMLICSTYQDDHSNLYENKTEIYRDSREGNPCR